jgi:hypothetical protein
MGGRPRIDGIGIAATLALGTGFAPDLQAQLAASTPAAQAATAVQPIGLGTAADDVASALGAPDIVTRGVSGREVWVWHRVPLDVLRSKTSWSTGALLAGAGVRVPGAGLTNAVTSRLAATPVTVVVRLDETGHLSSVALRSSHA